MSVKYNIVANGDDLSIAVVVGGDVYAASSSTHRNIRTIVNAAVEGREDVVSLILDNDTNLDTLFKSADFDRLSERVSIRDNEILIDGDPAPKALSDAIVEMYYESGDFEPLVNFLERLANNPNPDSVEQLYGWLGADDRFTITESGHLIAYKGVAQDNGQFVSISRGRAFVNGVEHNGQIPNNVGDVVEMPRSDVQFNPRVGCSVGLHAGTWDYASNFGRGWVLEVEIDPRDVVSVPHDCSAQKMRTCRYRVLDVIEAPHTTRVRGWTGSPEDAYDDDFWDDYNGWGEVEYDDYDLSGSYRC